MHINSRLGRCSFRVETMQRSMKHYIFSISCCMESRHVASEIFSRVRNIWSCTFIDILESKSKIILSTWTYKVSLIYSLWGADQWAKWLNFYARYIQYVAFCWVSKNNLMICVYFWEHDDMPYSVRYKNIYAMYF